MAPGSVEPHCEAKSRSPGQHPSAASEQPERPRSGRSRRRRFPRSRAARPLPGSHGAWPPNRSEDRREPRAARADPGTALRAARGPGADRPTPMIRRARSKPIGPMPAEMSGVTAAEAGKSRSRIDQPSCKQCQPQRSDDQLPEVKRHPDRSHEPQAGEEPAQESPVQVTNFAGHIVLRMLWQLPRRALRSIVAAHSTGIALIQEPRSSESWLRRGEQSRIGPARREARASVRIRRGWLPLACRTSNEPARPIRIVNRSGRPTGVGLLEVQPFQSEIG